MRKTAASDEARLRRQSAMVEIALEAIVAADHQGRIREFNPAAERTFGITRTEAVSRDLLQTILPPQQAVALGEGGPDQLLASIRRLGPRRIEATGCRADGSRFPMEMAIGIYEDQGWPALVVAVRDLTAKREAELARRESESKSRFLAIMSHELRTPLNSVLGFAQLLKGKGFEDLTPKQQRYLNHIETSGRHLLALISDVLDLARIAAGQMAVVPEQVEVLPLFKEAVGKVRVAAEAKRLELLIEPEPRLWVLADRRRLEQILINLLSNAVKFTNDGGRIALSSRSEGDLVELGVADTGIGIEPGEHLKIFEEFHQVDSGPTRSQPGTGLGLALTKRLVEVMGGRIHLESELGRGSTFTVLMSRTAPPNRIDGEGGLA